VQALISFPQGNNIRQVGILSKFHVLNNFE